MSGSKISELCKCIVKFMDLEDTMEVIDDNVVVMVRQHIVDCFNSFRKPKRYIWIRAAESLKPSKLNVKELSQMILEDFGSDLSPAWVSVIAECSHWRTKRKDTPLVGVEDVKSSGLAEELFCEYGDHLPTKNVGSNVYVLKRL